MGYLKSDIERLTTSDGYPIRTVYRMNRAIIHHIGNKTKPNKLIEDSKKISTETSEYRKRKRIAREAKKIRADLVSAKGSSH